MLGPLGARSRAAADAYAAVLIPILLYVVHSHSSRRCDIEKLYYPLSVHPVFYPILLEHPAASRPTNSRAGLRCCPSPAAAPPPACAAQTRTHGGTARAESTARLLRHVGEAATRRLLQLTDAAPGIPELLHTQRLYIARFTSGQQRWRQTACATAGCHLFGPFPRV